MIVYQSGYKYQLVQDYSFDLHPRFPETTYAGPFLSVSGREVTLSKGYASDGPSGPTVDTKTFMRGAFEHDATYQLIRAKVYPRKLRKYADIKLGQTLAEDGMWWLRRRWVLAGLKAFGSAAANPKNVKRSKRAGK